MLLRDDLLAPIAGADRGGSYLRYDPIYDRIREARREDLAIPQGEYKTALKTADWSLVLELTGEALATRSKDLQLAVWLTEAALKRAGFAGIREGLDLLRGLLEEFWDDLHPELEDGDAEFRAAPLTWLGQYLDGAVRSVPLNAEGHTQLDYLQAVALGYEADHQADKQSRATWQEAMAEGRLSADAFDAAVAATPTAWYEQLVASIDAALASLEALDRVADEKFGREAPSFLRLRQAMQEVRHTAGQLLAQKRTAEPAPPDAGPEAAAPPPAEPDSPAATSAAEPHAAPPVGEEAMPDPPADPVAEAARPPPRTNPAQGVTVSAVPASHDEAAAAVAAAARYLRLERRSDPTPYLLLRGFRWGELRRNGGSPEPHLLEAPPTELRVQLKRLLLDESWEELLDAAEEVMATPYGRGWLDLQRYVLAACEALGDDYRTLADALLGALRGLLHELPGLATATLMDDTPVANAETVAWLTEEGLLARPAAETGESPPEAEPRSRGPAARDPVGRAAALVRAGQPQRAVDVLMLQAAQEGSERDRFLRRLQAATILVDAGLEPVATPMLETMIAQIEQHKLEQWEQAATVAQPLALLYRCRRAAGDASSGVEELFLRVARLDPIRGLDLQGERDG